MSKCTAKQALERFAYWMGYHEKEHEKYSVYRDKAYFDTDPGDKNYTYFGYKTGTNGQPSCAATVSTVILEACDGSQKDAKAVMYGLWPYVRCDQLYDAAPSSKKGRRGSWTPKPGDVIVFGYSTRDHTGMLYAVDDTYVYTYEGNSSNKCQKRSYLKTSNWIWGYVRPDYEAGDDPDTPGELYGPKCCNDPELHELSKGCAGPEIETVQALLGRKFKFIIEMDGDFGRNTKDCVIRFQSEHNLHTDGIVGHDTWSALLKEVEP